MKPEFIIIHHSATPDGKKYDWEAIRRYHKSYAYKGYIISKEQAMKLLSEGVRGLKRPWKDIGYHYGIEKHNDIYIINKGRDLHTSGAHCKQQSMNKKSIGICVVGDYDKIEPPEEAWKLALSLTIQLMTAYKIPIKNILGHREVEGVIKSCPGNLFDMEKFRKEIRFY